MKSKMKQFMVLVCAFVLSVSTLIPTTFMTVHAASATPVLTAKADRDNGILLKWTASNRVSDPTDAEYMIMRKRDDGYYDGLVKRDPKYGLFFLDATNLTIGKEYTYKIRESVNGKEVDSNEVTVKAVASNPAANEFTNKAKAADYLKEQMVKRNKKISLIYNAGTFPSGLGNELYEMARTDDEKADPATATQGDYLRYTIKPNTIRITTGIDGKVGSLNSYTFTFELDYYTSKQEEEAVDAKVSQILASFANNGITQASSDYDKAKAVYDYLATNLHYNNNPRPDNGNLMITAYDSLVRKEAQCYGQTLGAYRLLKELGLVTRRVNGDLYLEDKKDTIAHGWNLVLMDGKWYNFDATGAATYYEETNDMTYKKLLKPYDTFVSQGYTLNAEYALTSAFGKAHPYGTTVYQDEPDAPNNLTLVNLGEGKIQASFTSVKGADGYALYRSTSATGTFSKVAEGNATTLIDETAQPGVEYHYKVKAYAMVSGDRLYSSYSPRRIITSKSIGTPVLSALTATSNTVKVSWDAVAGAEYYQVYRADSVNGTYSLVNRKNYTTTTISDAAVSAGKTYYYKVRAFRDGEYSMFSTISSVTTKPATPTGIQTSSAGATSVNVQWAKSEGAKYYQVYRSTNATKDFRLLGVYDENTFSMKSRALLTNQTYYYKVRAYTVVNKKGIYSPFSNVVKGTPKLAAPTNVKASPNTSTTLKISWKLTDGATYYQVYRSTSKTGKYALLGVYNSTTTSSISRSLLTGNTYYYKVRAYRWVKGERVFSPFSSVITGKPVLSKTSKVTAKATSSTTAKITWNKIEGATYYQVYRGTSANGKYALLATYDKNTTTCTSKKLKKGNTYYYKVRAYKWVKGTRVFSPFSTPVKVKI
jgi:putative S-layer protein